MSPHSPIHSSPPHTNLLQPILTLSTAPDKNKAVQGNIKCKSERLDGFINGAGAESDLIGCITKSTAITTSPSSGVILTPSSGVILPPPPAFVGVDAPASRTSTVVILNHDENNVQESRIKQPVLPPNVFLPISGSDNNTGGTNTGEKQGFTRVNTRTRNGSSGGSGGLGSYSSGPGCRTVPYSIPPIVLPKQRLPYLPHPYYPWNYPLKSSKHHQVVHICI